MPPPTRKSGEPNAPVGMAFTKISHDLFLVVIDSKGPNDAAWANYLAAVRGACVELTRHLLYTDGGAPNPLQRRRMNDLFDGRAVPVAVLCTSAEARSAVAAMRWFNPLVASFPPWPIEPALAHLDIPREHGALLEREIARMRASLTRGTR